MIFLLNMYRENNNLGIDIFNEIFYFLNKKKLDFINIEDIYILDLKLSIRRSIHLILFLYLLTLSFSYLFCG